MAEPKRRRGKAREESSARAPEPPRVAPLRENVREFRYPQDLEVYFHRNCAPRVELPEKVKQELVDILAKALVDDLRRNPPKTG
jgi:hypothetical protein